jgi:hypothetical protein
MSGAPIDDGGPAFPETRWDDKMAQEVQWLGMTLRDYFAGQQLCAETVGSPDSRARWAYEMADAMLKARQS